jgi:hypothetical protein
MIIVVVVTTDKKYLPDVDMMMCSVSSGTGTCT